MKNSSARVKRQVAAIAALTSASEVIAHFASFPRCGSEWQMNIGDAIQASPQEMSLLQKTV